MNLHIKCQQNTLLIGVWFWTFTFGTVNGFNPAIPKFIFCNSTLSTDNNDIIRGVELFDTAYDTWSDTKFKKANAHFSILKNRYPHNYEPLYWLNVVNFYLVTYYLFGMEKDYNKKQLNYI